jgi:NAD-dependent SIR2 family protein deacetylase
MSKTRPTIMSYRSQSPDEKRRLANRERSHHFTIGRPVLNSRVTFVGPDHITSMSSSSFAAAQAVLRAADRIVIGAGAGLSASGGINYVGGEFFAQHYVDWAKQGYSTIWETMGTMWRLTPTNATKYWAFLSHHFITIRYDYPVVQPYLDLLQYLKGRDYFVVTTNVDHQFHKAQFPEDKIWAMQGDYALLQCQKPCSREVYPNEEMVRAMKATFDPATLTIDAATIPMCPRCGRNLVPNLRSDDTFVEEPHLVNRPRYRQFLDESAGKKVVFLELGVGFNSPGAIKWPFEQLVASNPTFRLVRVNLNDPQFMLPIQARSTVVTGDIAEFLKFLVADGE